MKYVTCSINYQYHTKV